MTGRYEREWQRFLNATDPAKFGTRLRTEFRKAAVQIGQRFVLIARQKITDKEYEPNALITILLKGSTTPLVASDGAPFRSKSIAYEVTDDFGVFVGAMRFTNDRGADIALILHEGAIIDTNKNPQVRPAVFAKLRESVPKMPKITKGNGLWIIPPRPYVNRVLESSEFQDFTVHAWEKAWIRTWQNT